LWLVIPHSREVTNQGTLDPIEHIAVNINDFLPIRQAIGRL